MSNSTHRACSPNSNPFPWDTTPTNCKPLFSIQWAPQPPAIARPDFESISKRLENQPKQQSTALSESDKYTFGAILWVTGGIVYLYYPQYASYWLTLLVVAVLIAPARYLITSLFIVAALAFGIKTTLGL